MSKTKKFKGVIEEFGTGGGMGIEVPFDVEKEFGKKRVKILATFDGEPYRGTLGRMGGRWPLGILKNIREKIGKGPGDTVEVTLQEDVEPRVVEVPDDLQKALSKDRKAAEFFEGLSYTHRKEYVRWIVEAKREETRRTRVEKAIVMMREGKRGM